MRFLAPFLAFSTLIASAGIAQQRHLVEGIVVRVNERILTVADMRARVLEREAELGTSIAPGDYGKLVAEAADDLCLLERATELKVEISPEEVSATLQQLREQNHAPDEATFSQMLVEMGMTVEQLRRRLQDTLLINRVLSREVGNLPVTDEELRQRYEKEKEAFTIPERVHLEHIVFPVSMETGDRARKIAMADRLLAAARSSQDFATLIATEVSSGQGQGGDLGILAVNDLRAEVKDAVKDLAPGQITEPFSSSSGVHLARVVDRIPPTVKPFSDVAEELRQRELGERYRARLRGVVDGLKTRYVVETHPERFTAPS